MIRRAVEWLESRTGWPGLVSHALEERIPGGARLRYVFGSAVLFLLFAQLVTGLSLALGYSASVSSAWASVARLEATSLGHLLRALHAHGTTFILVLVGLHLLQTALAGAYRAPREVTWWLGLLLFAVLLAFALTGSLLPWDERGYWATKVTAGIAATVPLVGDRLARLLVGGADLGNLSLTRFFALHAVLLPALLVLLTSAHLFAVRRHGITPPLKADLTREEAFWPRQALYDSAFAVLLLAGLLAFSLARGAPLGAPADPSGAAVPRPEWYFRPLFMLLSLLGGGLEEVATVFVPLAVAAFLVLMPALDRGVTGITGYAKRPALWVLIAGMIGAIALGFASYVRDARDPQFQRQVAAAEKRAKKALRLAKSGVPPEGGLALLNAQPEDRGQKLFAQRCLECHRVGGEGARKAPVLDGYLSVAWVQGVIAHPEAAEYFGNTKVRGMDAFEKLGREKLQLLAEFLVSLREVKGGPETFLPRHDAGRRVFEQAGCGDCHSLKPGESGLGPTLARYGSNEWLLGLLRDAGSPVYYDGDNAMPAFGRTLSARDLDDLVAYLRTLAVPEEPLAARP